MKRFCRREVLKLGTASALAALAPSWPNLTLARTRAPALVLADLRYSDSIGFARGAELAGAVFVPLVRNLGEIWFDIVKPRLPGPLVVTGLTLESDLFILTRLAEGSGVATAYEGTHDWRPGAESAHTLGGTLRLDRPSAALTGGGANWAERLGSALLQANLSGLEQSGRKRKIALQLKQSPAADSPRYLVSWLLSSAPGTLEIG